MNQQRHTKRVEEIMGVFPVLAAAADGLVSRPDFPEISLRS
jgi:hypothetical protein